MNLRTFLRTLVIAPIATACTIPVVGNSPEEIKHRKHLNDVSLKVGDKVLVIQPFRNGRNFDFGPGYVHSNKHPLGTYCVRFEKGIAYNDYKQAGGILTETEYSHREWLACRVLFGHYAEDEIVVLNR